jgi:protein TonB
MEEKKNPNIYLENKKGAYFAVGLLFTLAIVLALFEFKTFPVQIQDLGKLEVNLMEEEVIPVSMQAPPPPPPPPAPTTQIEIVEDDVEIEEELEIIDMEVDEDTEIEVVIEEEPEEEIVEEEIFTIVENMPEFPGGTEALFKYLGKNIKYPAMAKDAGIKGKVYVTFVVDKDGSIADVRVLRGIGGGCDEEAIRVVGGMPKWAPGKQRGKAVRVQYNLPINFILK